MGAICWQKAVLALKGLGEGGSETLLAAPVACPLGRGFLIYQSALAPGPKNGPGLGSLDSCLFMERVGVIWVHGDPTLGLGVDLLPGVLGFPLWVGEWPLPLSVPVGLIPETGLVRIAMSERLPMWT